MLVTALGTPAVATDVTFRDEKLESAVRAALEMPSAQAVTDTDMHRLSTLVVIDQGIKDLDGLEYATNLEFLAMPDNEIKDLSPLSGLSGLRTVYLDGNRIVDIGPLCALPGIMDINLNDNQIQAIPQIAWASPYFLQMRNNRISDLSGFTGYARRFESIDLSDNRIADVSPLSSLMIGSPMSLVLTDNRITDISPLLRDGEMTAFFLAVERNHLDLSEGSAATGDITTLQDKNATVTYLPQERGRGSGGPK